MPDFLLAFAARDQIKPNTRMTASPPPLLRSEIGRQMRSRGAASRISSLKLGVSAACLALAGSLSTLAPSPALAFDECGGFVLGVATCNGDGIPATGKNFYAGGIAYDDNNGTVVVDGRTVRTTNNFVTGVTFVTKTGANRFPTVNIVGGTIDTTGSGAIGVVIGGNSQGTTTDATVNSSGVITTSGPGANGIQCICIWKHALCFQFDR